MPKINHLYRQWLKARHLPPNGTNATIAKVTIEKLHPRPGQVEEKAVLQFSKSSKLLILNQGNYNRLIDLTGSDDTDDWVNVTVRLTPGKWGTNDTIILSKLATNGKEAGQ